MTALDGVNGTVCNAQQYQQSLQYSHLRSPSIKCLSHGDIIGILLYAEASFLSCICVVIIFIRIGWNVHWYNRTFPNGTRKLFQGPADIYMFSLFVFDILQATSGILSIKWLHDGMVTRGHYCTVQGLVKQISEVGVALISLLLAVHTFVVSVLPVGLNTRGVALSLVCLVCVFITLWVAIGAGIHKNYETPQPFWCWIGPQYSGQRLGGDYIWMWIAVFASAILYVPLYFWAEGFWEIDEDYRFHWYNPDQRVGSSQKRAALGMLLYPLAYSIVVIPVTVTRWLQFTHHHVPSAATFFGISLFYLSGTINVLLFLIARPELLLFHRREELDDQEMQLAPQDTGPVIFSHTTQFQRNPEQTPAALADGGRSKDSAISPRVNSTSTRISIDI